MEQRLPVQGADRINNFAPNRINPVAPRQEPRESNKGAPPGALREARPFLSAGRGRKDLDIPGKGRYHICKRERSESLRRCLPRPGFAEDMGGIAYGGAADQVQHIGRGVRHHRPDWTGGALGVRDLADYPGGQF